MKKDIHPEYKPAKITCVCGNVIQTRSTQGDYEIQICSKCHPFFTGKQKFVDTAGRVERRYAKSDLHKPATQPAASAAKAAAAKVASPTPAAPSQAAPKKSEA